MAKNGKKKFRLGKARVVEVEAPSTTGVNKKNVQRKVQQQSSDVVEVSVPVKRGRGRPRKHPATIVPSPQEHQNGENAPEDKHIGARAPRDRRVSNEVFLKSEGEARRVVPLAAVRIADQLQTVIANAEVAQFRGRQERPPIRLSALQFQAIKECAELMNLKVTLQRTGVIPRQKIVNV